MMLESFWQDLFFHFAEYSDQILHADLWRSELPGRWPEGIRIKASEVFSDADNVLGVPHTIYWRGHSE